MQSKAPIRLPETCGSSADFPLKRPQLGHPFNPELSDPLPLTLKGLNRVFAILLLDLIKRKEFHKQICIGKEPLLFRFPFWESKKGSKLVIVDHPMFF